MNRIGLNADNIEVCSKIIRHFAETSELAGIFTHLCVADTPSGADFTKTQIGKFKKIANAIEDLHLPYIQCINSAGSLWQQPYSNLARLGIILCGLKPDYANALPEGIRPALSWKSTITIIKNVNIGKSRLW